MHALIHGENSQLSSTSRSSSGDLRRQSVIWQVTGNSIPQRVHDALEAVKINPSVVVDRDAEVVQQRLLQQPRPAARVVAVSPRNQQC